ncbi:hypothetical protein [Synoicihabitans lomoniglobus]|uniref:DUF4410 domain-containing protein n=1 Tax=Synoicihabitans lomoniglobus TaxID=2909285 RepID=A0AAF0I4A5_9BACT|nr:hypothetical protein [Opitutaceae bacterium LMO-M01]WED66659.1 hypothetical protein PXH66_07320 [Opitutaceae bacterium LMO-M01]
MRAFILALLICFGLSACATLEEATGLKLADTSPQRNYYARPQPQVFEAMVGVLGEMNYEISKSAPAQGVIEAYGRLLETEKFGNARQFLISVKVRPVGETESSVELLVREAREGDFKVGAVSQSHGVHGRYDSIFEALEKVLGEGSWLPPSQPARD